MAAKLMPSEQLSAFLGIERGVPVSAKVLAAAWASILAKHTKPFAEPRSRTKGARVGDPDYARIQSEREGLYYDVASLRSGKVRVAHDDLGNTLGFGACENCGRALETTLRIDSAQPYGVSYWKKHLPDFLTCKECGQAYEVSYVVDEGEHKWRTVTGAEREALR